MLTSESQLLQPQPFSRSKTLGIMILGECQTGKTSLGAIFAEQWNQSKPDNPAYSFSVSNGYRGLTAHVLQENGVRSDEAVEDTGGYRRLLQDYVSHKAPEIPDVLRMTFVKPADKTVLRSKAVDSVIATTGENPAVREQVGKAGGVFIGAFLKDPSLIGRKTSPGLIIMDGRNSAEARYKFDCGGVQHAGDIVTACPPHIRAKRILGPEASNEDLQTEIRRLKLRDAQDRARQCGRMTLARDYKVQIKMAGLLDDPGHVRYVGQQISKDPKAAAIFNTDILSLQEEARIANGLLQGMASLALVQRLRLKDST